MTLSNTYATVLVACIALVLAGAFILKPVDTVVEIPQPEKPLLKEIFTGAYTFCLPKQDNFSSEECVEGLRTDEGEYYALDFSLMSSERPILRNDDSITVRGVVSELTGSIGKGKISVTKIDTTITPKKESATGTCYVGGCSGQICSGEKDMASTCEYRAEYQCYKEVGAKCERQVETGKCGWTPTERLYMCLDSKGFEGEANPAVMTLPMNTWKWNKSDKFSITFNADGKFSTKTDCNSVGGSYVAKGSSLTFSNIFTTEMFCQESVESTFVDVLENTVSYKFTSKGELILIFKNGGTEVFR